MTLAPGFIIRGESVTRYSTIKINKYLNITEFSAPNPNLLYGIWYTFVVPADYKQSTLKPGMKANCQMQWGDNEWCDLRKYEYKW